MSEPRKANMDSMKKQAIMDMLQRAKSFTPEMVIMHLKRDLRPVASTRLLNTQLDTMLLPKLDHKLKACFQDTTCRDLMKLCQRIMHQDHKLDPKFQELNQLHKVNKRK